MTGPLLTIEGRVGLAAMAVDEMGKKYTVKLFILRKDKIKSGCYGHMNMREIDFLVSCDHPNINSAHKILTKLPFFVKHSGLRQQLQTAMPPGKKLPSSSLHEN